jgi:hypothetical protein
MSDAANTRSTTKKHWCDEQDLPEWGIGPDARPVKIDDDERLPQLFAEWQADACSHPVAVTTREPDSLGRPQYFERCDHCGLKLSSAVSHQIASARTIDGRGREEMDTIAQRYVTSRRQQLEAITRAAAERCQPGNRQSYDDYLRSPAWKRRAQKILDRAKGVCEGCLTNTAEEVHHLTYDHLGAEFAFELVALCGPCHRRWHGRETV